MRRAAEYSCGAYCIAWSANVAGSATTSTLPSSVRLARAVLAIAARKRSSRSTSCSLLGRLEGVHAGVDERGAPPATRAWSRRPLSVSWTVTTRPSSSDGWRLARPAVSIRIIAV